MVLDERLSRFNRKAAKQRKDAADYALIRDVATDKVKRELYAKLSQHLEQLAKEVERAMNAPKAG